MEIINNRHKFDIQKAERFCKYLQAVAKKWQDTFHQRMTKKDLAKLAFLPIPPEDIKEIDGRKYADVTNIPDATDLHYYNGNINLKPDYRKRLVIKRLVSESNEAMKKEVSGNIETDPFVPKPANVGNLSEDIF